MKNQIIFTTREQAVKDGFNFAGTTTDETMLREIRRDYLSQGYSEMVFARAQNKIIYYTKHPFINP